jgi:hypothetical protein
MERPHDPCPAPPDVVLQVRGLEILLDVHIGEALARKAPQERQTILLRPFVLPPVPDTAHGEDNGKTGAGGQPSGSRELRFNEMICAQLDKIDPAAQGFQAAKVRLQGFGGEDQADPCRAAQKSLLYT